jgi:isopentenyldiphosphate isomerase
MNEELIDVCTPDGILTGSRKSKSAVHRDGDWHVSVHLWILTPDGRLLLQRRADGKENFPGLWDVSVAGHISSGETAAEAGIREAAEEIGVDVGNDRFEFLARVAEQVVLRDGTYRDNEIHDIYLVRRDVDPATLVLQAEEVAAVRLVEIQEVARMVARMDSTLVPHWHEYQMLLRHLSDGAPTGVES